MRTWVVARSARCTRCPFCITRVFLLPSRRVVAPLPVSTTFQHYSAVGTPKASQSFRCPLYSVSLIQLSLALPFFLSFSFSLCARGCTHVTWRAFGRMPGQSARTARNVIAGSPSGDEKRALISRTLLEELSRKLSKRRELVVAGSVSRLSCVGR